MIQFSTSTQHVVVHIKDPRLPLQSCPAIGGETVVVRVQKGDRQKLQLAGDGGLPTFFDASKEFIIVTNSGGNETTTADCEKGRKPLPRGFFVPCVAMYMRMQHTSKRETPFLPSVFRSESLDSQGGGRDEEKKGGD